MNCIEVMPQFLLTKAPLWARMVGASDALPTAIIHLLVYVVLDVLGIIASIFHLHKTTLRHAVRTPTGRCKDAFCSDRTIDNVRASSVMYNVSVLV